MKFDVQQWLDRTLRQNQVTSKKQTHDAIHKLAKKIQADYEGRNPIFIVVLSGAFRFASDLIGQLNCTSKTEIAYVQAESYDDIIPGKLRFDPMGLDSVRLTGRDVIIVEDIIDSGRTMKRVSEYVLQQNPSSIQAAVLIDKGRHENLDICVTYVAHPELTEGFFVGFGMDWKNLFRTINYISVLTPEMRERLMADQTLFQ